MRAQLIIERCRALAAYSESPSGLRRTFLSPPMRDVHRLLRVEPGVPQWLLHAVTESASARTRVPADLYRGVSRG